MQCLHYLNIETVYYLNVKLNLQRGLKDLNTKSFKLLNNEK